MNLARTPLPMPNSTRIRPVVVSDPSHQLQLTYDWHDNHGGCRGTREYWHARRAFLASYHFSEQKKCGFKDKLKRSFSEAAQGIACRTRLGMRARKLRLGLPSRCFGMARCFVPWLNNTNTRGLI